MVGVLRMVFRTERRIQFHALILYLLKILVLLLLGGMEELVTP
jgi:hypothetical protein